MILSEKKHRNDIEVDFLISNESKLGFKVMPLEVKSSKNYPAVSYEKFKKRFQGRVGESYVATQRRFRKTRLGSAFQRTCFTASSNELQPVRCTLMAPTSPGAYVPSLFNDADAKARGELRRHGRVNSTSTHCDPRFHQRCRNMLRLAPMPVVRNWGEVSGKTQASPVHRLYTAS